MSSVLGLSHRFVACWKKRSGDRQEIHQILLIPLLTLWAMSHVARSNAPHSSQFDRFSVSCFIVLPFIDIHATVVVRRHRFSNFFLPHTRVLVLPSHLSLRSEPCQPFFFGFNICTWWQKGTTTTPTMHNVATMAERPSAREKKKECATNNECVKC